MFCVKREKTLCEGGKKEKGDNSRQPFEINLDPRLIGCVWVCLGGWILNLRQELQDGGGEQRSDGQSDEIDECSAHEPRPHQGHHKNSSQSERTNQSHTQN